MSNTYKLEGPNTWGYRVDGSFECNSGVTPTTTAGSNYTVARTGTGVFVVTVPKMNKIVACTSSIEHSGLDVIEASLTATDESANTVTFTTISGASGAAKSAADLGSDVTVHFVISGQRTAI